MIAQLEISTWSEFKNIVENRCYQIQYVESDTSYDLFGFSRHTSETWHIKADKLSADGLDFEATFKSTATKVSSIVTCLTDINGQDIAGTVEETPNSLTLLGRLKSIYDKLAVGITATIDKVKIWDGTTTAAVTSEGRLKVDVYPAGYAIKAVSSVADVTIAKNTDYYILDVSEKTGILDEIHIITDNNKFYIKIEVDGVVVFNQMLDNLKTQFLLDVATVKTFQTTNSTDFHSTFSVLFNNSIKIGLRTAETGKKLKGYIILYKERSI